MSRPPNICVYCGSAGVTKEHIRGAWSVRHAPRLGRTSHTLVKTDKFDPSIVLSQTKGPGDRPGTPRSQTLKIACRACNNGWMKDIVDRAIPIVGRMNYGYWGRIYEFEARALEHWVALFVMSYEFCDRSTVCISYDERQRFRLTSKLSDSWHIAIGYADISAWSDKTVHRAMRIIQEDGSESHACITVFLHGNLIALAFYCELNLWFDFKRVMLGIGLEVLSGRYGQISKPFRVHSDYSVSGIVEYFSEFLEDSLYNI